MREVTSSFAWDAIPAGLFLGQFQVCVAIAALYRRSPLEGFAIGISLTIAGVLAASLSVAFSGSYLPTLDWLMLLYLPALIMSACLPLWILRQLRHWQFCDRHAHPLNSKQFGIGDLLVGTSLLASSLILVRAPYIIWETDSSNMWGVLAVLAGFCITPTLLLLIPALLISFCIRKPLLRWLGMLTLGLVLVGGSSGYMIWYESSSNGSLEIPEFASSTAIFGTVALVTLFIGLGSLKQSNYALVGKRRKATGSTTAPHELEQSPAKVSSPWPGRLIAAGLLLFAIVTNLAVSAVQNHRRLIDETLASLEKDVAERGGKIEIRNREVVTLNAWPDMDDAELQAFDLSNLETLSLADSAITDVALRALKGTSIYSLDLSRTAITDEGLELLGREFGYFQELSLAGTNVTPAAVARLSHQLPIYALNLNNLGMTDREFQSISLRNLSSLAIIGNPISVESTQQLRFISRLELGRNNIRGGDFSFLAQTESLVLDEFQLTDVEFAGLANRAKRLYSLTLRRTDLTDAALPTIEAMDLDYLEIGDGRITENGLAASGIRRLYGLKLQSTQFTGSCFDVWPVSLTELSMRKSGITDNTVANLRKLMWLQSLDLAHTSIGDAVVPIVNDLQIAEVNLTGTQVTADGVRRLGETRIVISPKQFTQEEVTEFRSLGIEMSYESGGK